MGMTARSSAWPLMGFPDGQVVSETVLDWHIVLTEAVRQHRASSPGTHRVNPGATRAHSCMWRAASTLPICGDLGKLPLPPGIVCGTSLCSWKISSEMETNDRGDNSHEGNRGNGPGRGIGRNDADR